MRSFADCLDPSRVDELADGLSPGAAALLLKTWHRWARPEQRMPPDDAAGPGGAPWLVWLVLAGRGWGKTRTGAEAVRAVVESGRYGRVALVAPTAADARDTMVEGESGLLAVHADGARPRYHPSKRRVVWPSGAVATLYSAEQPERLRGPQHDFFWADELCAWAYPVATWDNLQFGLRLGPLPRGVVTTTPRPIGLLRELVAREGRDVVVTRGHTMENRKHLPVTQVRYLLDRYEGTTVGRQELAAELLGELPGALWTRGLIEACRGAVPDELTRVVVGVDPTVADEPGDACGVIAAGRDGPGTAYVLRDWTVRGSPKTWAAQVVRAYHRHGAGLVVAEGNQGGALVREVVHAVDPSVPVAVVHASRAKAARAEPVVARYEQGRVVHARGADLGALEDEMVTWEPGGPSPNRLDAAVWGLTELLLRGSGEATAEVL